MKWEWEKRKRNVSNWNCNLSFHYLVLLCRATTAAEHTDSEFYEPFRMVRNEILHWACKIQMPKTAHWEERRRKLSTSNDAEKKYLPIFQLSRAHSDSHTSIAIQS